jgi:hypothetical protein
MKDAFGVTEPRHIGGYIISVGRLLWSKKEAARLGGFVKSLGKA